jgi:hypothetical protein
MTEISINNFLFVSQKCVGTKKKNKAGIDGGNLTPWGKPQTCHKSLRTFIT